MATINLENLSVKELKEVIETAQSLIGTKEKEERKAALAAARGAAAKLGYDLDELVRDQHRPAERKGGKRQLAPKYRHPENPELTWSGVGRKPKWMQEAEDAGRRDDLRIKD